MGKNTKLEDNFYQHYNQEWIEKTPIPDGYSSWGSFEILHQKSLDDVKNLIESLKKNPAKLNLAQTQILNLFDNYLNFNKRNEQGISPIQPIINKIDQLSSKADFTKFLIESFLEFKITFFHSIGIDSDDKNSFQRASIIDSIDLGMRDRDFYEPTNNRYQELKNAYEIYVNSLIKESGVSFNGTNVFQTIFDFETEAAKVMLKPEEWRDPNNTYNVVDFAQLNQLCSFIDWKTYFNQTGYDKAKIMVLHEPKFFAKLNELLLKTDLTAIKDIMKFQVLSSFSKLLTEKIYEIKFQYASIFNGIEKMKTPINQAVEFVNKLLGEIIGQEYIKEHFSESAKQDVLTIVKDLIRIYSNRIQKLDWMSQTTKQQAIEKLNAITIKIGYPDKWNDFSSVIINKYADGGSLFENVMNISKFFIEKNLKEIALPVDRDKWSMHPQTVNAYYNPNTNEICFPAGILQAPFYDIKQSKAQNLGGIGAVIGHEVSHGFDDQGSRYDKIGNLNNWWTDEDHQQYHLRTQKLVEQYNQYQIDGIHVNGKFTLGENIGDLSGLAAALDICKEQCPNDLKAFFENNAMVWRRTMVDRERHTRLVIDPHSPEEFRCNGVFIHLDEFHETYNTKPGDQMYLDPEKRIKVW
ncbi:M13 family metallopeptidase [Williamsoniiplasma luminosum]|uniref:Endopeptidase O n=1 Tax=Williamsoniiplasma luminosum TaxID=214888 RepID=A0A2S0NJW4_9MOLU|nr:M13 family metallopeptidase [Williamsoniiplasma luminosum]AVP49298.1 MAG: hypothetical protein C5T88_01740 [Williamsoniiplasma luminosum]